MSLQRSALAHQALVAPVVFGVLVAATIAAFFVMTRLKRSPPVVEKLSFARHISPNGDGRSDSVEIGFRIKRADQVTVTLIDEDGDEVTTLARDQELEAGRHRFRWSGRTGLGHVAPDGEYRVRVGLRDAGRSITSRRKLFVDKTAPRPVVRYVSPSFISPDGIGTANRAVLRFDGPRRGRPVLLVYRTGNERPRLVARRVGRGGSNELGWDGRVGAAGRRRAPTGNYLLVVSVRDAAGNVGPPGLPPERGALQGHPGIAVRYVAAKGPATPVTAGSDVSFSVATDGRRYRWSVRRLGSGRTLDRGRSRVRQIRFPAPRGRSGVFLFTVRVGSHRYTTPFAVQTRDRARVLVVLPYLSWQARNPVDSNGDGFGDVLPEDPEVSLRREFAGNGFPPGFTAREGPLLLFLDRRRLRYDITTDLALAEGKARPPARYRGILFAGPPRFFPRGVARLARAYVETGGRLAWLGTGGFTSPVKLSATHVASAGGPSSGRRNALGERLRGEPAGGLLTVLADRIRFFGGVGGVFGPFPSLEVSRALPRGARLLASAGHDAGRPSLVVYRLGPGVVARVGADGWARSATGSRDVERIMRRLWTLLSH